MNKLRLNPEQNPLGYAIDQIKREIRLQGGAAKIAKEFARRTGLTESSAQAWIGDMQHDLRRKITVASRGNQMKLHLYRLGVLINTLDMPDKEETEIVTSIRRVNSSFTYPPSESPPDSSDRKIKRPMTPRGSQ